MPSVGLLMLFSIGGAWMCIKARAAGPAAVFAGLALVLFISTPLGSGLPGAIGTLFSVVDGASTPALTEVQTTGATR